MAEFNLGPLNTIPPGEGRVFLVNEVSVTVFRTRSEQFYAVQSACPHKGGPLVDGLLGGTTLICPLHGWKFDLSNGQPLFGDCGLKTYSVRVDATGTTILLQLD